MSRNRMLNLFLVLALVVVTAGGSWYAGSRIQSPAEAAARTAPPAPSPILVPVEERVLTSNIVTRGTARYGLPQAISIVPSTLKPTSGVSDHTARTRHTDKRGGCAAYGIRTADLRFTGGDTGISRSRARRFGRGHSPTRRGSLSPWL